MRLRNIKGSREAIAASPCALQEEDAVPGFLQEHFGNGHPIHMEIGMGKGKFLMALAKKNPHINYIGIEKYSSVLIRALEKMDEEEYPLSNLYFLRMDAEHMGSIFRKGEVERIYLNFSDPWPKDRHARRRLTSTTFLARYEQILAPGGQIEFKTDNRPLFDFSLESLKEAGWMLKAATYDLHHDPALMEGNIMTEYEERFSSMGNPIHKFIAVPGPEKACS